MQNPYNDEVRDVDEEDDQPETDSDEVSEDENGSDDSEDDQDSDDDLDGNEIHVHWSSESEDSYIEGEFVQRSNQESGEEDDCYDSSDA